MSTIIASFATAFLLLAGQATAHMKIAHPVPFGELSLDTSPLKNAKPGTDGSDYPCKQRTGVYDISTMNNMTVGSSNLLSFDGSATHAGGTCQLSITLDKEPTASSVFKVIKVFEGGCPCAATGSGVALDFHFTIPKGFPNGQATFAWLWYNRLGGTREVYMNCAPITVTGGSDSKDVFNSLPNQYLINLPTSECQGIDSTDLIIPNPGQDVEKAAGAILKAATGPSCAASAAAQTSGLSGYQTASPEGNGTQAASSTAIEAASTSAPVSYSGGAPSIVTNSTAAPASSTTAPSSENAGGSASSMITISTSAPAYSAPAATSESAEPPASYPTLTASSGAGIYGPGTSASTGTAPAATGSSSSGSTCTTNGALVCNGTNQFGLCNNGNVVWQAVAAGTTCNNGQIMKRSAFRHAHVRRHAQNGEFRRVV